MSKHTKKGTARDVAERITKILKKHQRKPVANDVPEKPALVPDAKKPKAKQEQKPAPKKKATPQVPLRTVWVFDTENDACSHPSVYANVSAQDEVWWLWTPNKANIPIFAFEAFAKADVETHVMRCRIGTQNALDFQIMSLVGYKVALYGTSARYVIVSNDAGFDAGVSFWKSRGYDISRETGPKNSASYKGVKDFVVNFQHKAEDQSLACKNASKQLTPVPSQPQTSQEGSAHDEPKTA